MSQSAKEKQAAIAWLLENAPAAVRTYVNGILQELSAFEAAHSGIIARQKAIDVSGSPAVDD
jgi:predicted transcriptional regulator